MLDLIHPWTSRTLITLDSGTTKGTCKALVQSLRARTASLMSLERMPSRISGGCMEGSHPSLGDGCDAATCKHASFDHIEARSSLVCGRSPTDLHSLSKKLPCISICCELPRLAFNISLGQLLQQIPSVLDGQAYRICAWLACSAMRRRVSSRNARPTVLGSTTKHTTLLLTTDVACMVVDPVVAQDWIPRRT